MSLISDTNKEGESKPEPELFKTRKPRSFRKRKLSEDDAHAEEDIRPKLEEMRQLQNLRKKPNGVSLLGLALGKKVSTEDEAASNDPFKVNSGGMVNMQALRSGKVKQVDDAYDTGIGTQFSVETNKRDEDEEMMKYIEEQLSKRKGSQATQQVNLKDMKSYLSPEEAALQAVPDHLRESSTKRSEEMLSNQMLSGIPEIDLGIEAKIKNIEATEEAKLKLLWEHHNKKDGPSQFVPSNMAVNFVQHNRFTVDGPEMHKKKYKVQELEVGVQGGERSKLKKEEKATDDYHYERFKKLFRH